MNCVLSREKSQHYEEDFYKHKNDSDGYPQMVMIKLENLLSKASGVHNKSEKNYQKFLKLSKDIDNRILNLKKAGVK